MSTDENKSQESSLRPFIQNWIEWLNDPLHKQGKGRLRDFEDRYCCLGGLCEVLGYTAEPHNEGYCYEGKGLDLPLSIQVKYGLDRVGRFHLKSNFVTTREGLEYRLPPRFQETLANVNDVLRWPFPVIAKLVEHIEKERAWLR